MLVFCIFPSLNWGQKPDQHKDNFLFGHPIVYNHNSKYYNAGSQIWDIKVAHGRVFFANNGGLLTYDGISWKNFSTKNNTIVRSLFLDGNDKIYVGAQGEFGYYDIKEGSNFEFIGLDSLFQVNNEKLNEIWNIFVIDSALCLSSGPNLYHLSDTINVISAKNTIECMALINGEVWFFENNRGLQMMAGKSPALVFQKPYFHDKKVVEVLSVSSDSIFILTENHGIYLSDGQNVRKWVTNADEFLKNKTISSAEFSSEGLIVGTYFGGVVGIDYSGRTTLHLDVSKGLQSNKINALKMAPNGVLWIGSNKGIDEVDLKNRKRYFFPDGSLRGSVYDLELLNDYLFFSTSNGLYYLKKRDYYNPLTDYDFKLIPGTQGQCWGTDVIDGRLFCAHHEGALIVDSELKAQKLSEEPGAWKFVKIAPDIIAIGFYYGISIYRRSGNTYEKIRDIPGFDESARIMVQDKYNNLWVSHPYKDVYRFDFDENYQVTEIKKYNQASGLESRNKNYLSLIDSICFVTSPTGIYVYNHDKDNFETAEAWDSLFQPDLYLRRIFQYGEDLWCITDSSTAKVERQSIGVNLSTRLVNFPDINTAHSYIGGFEGLFPIFSGRFFIASPNGMIEYLIRDHPDSIRAPVIKSLTTGLDSLIYFFSPDDNEKKLTFSYKHNNIVFSYDSHFPNNNEQLSYSYKLSGLNDNWSGWTTEKRMRFNDLSPGDYEFKIRSKDPTNFISPTRLIKFRIQPPWYRSRMAHIGYALSVGLVLFLLFYWPKKKYQKDKEELLQAKKRSEQSLAQIKKEKILNELEFNKRELVNFTFHLVQKQQTIKSLKQKVNEFSGSIEDKEVKEKLKEMMSIIRGDMRIEEDWENFSFHFDQVHEGFISKMKKRYPHLSNDDYKLCTYLKMNMSSKDIAPLLNISVRGVELKRYRLRKKLNMDRSEDLNEFLNTQI